MAAKRKGKSSKSARRARRKEREFASLRIANRDSGQQQVAAPKSAAKAKNKKQERVPVPASLLRQMGEAVKSMQQLGGVGEALQKHMKKVAKAGRSRSGEGQRHLKTTPMERRQRRLEMVKPGVPLASLFARPPSPSEPAKHPHDHCQMCGCFLERVCFSRTPGTQRVPSKHKICDVCYWRFSPEERENWYEHIYVNRNPPGTGWYH